MSPAIHFSLIPGRVRKAAASAAICGLTGIGPVSAAAVQHEVLAYYYPWYGVAPSGERGNHWGRINASEHRAAETTHFPDRGAYNSRDPTLVAEHISQAKSNGITCFIASWWGPDTYEERCLPVLLEKAEAANFKISAFWEKAPGKGQAQIDNAVSDLTRLLTRFGTNKAFLKVDGKPVIFVYERVTSEVPENAWGEDRCRSPFKGWSVSSYR